MPLATRFGSMSARAFGWGGGVLSPITTNVQFNSGLTSGFCTLATWDGSANLRKVSCAGNDGNNSVANTTAQIPTGVKAYYEFINTGIATIIAGSKLIIPGIIISGSSSTNVSPGNSAASWGGYCDGVNFVSYHNSVSTNISADTWLTGAVIMFAVDTVNNKMWMGKNGTWYGSGNPASGANPLFTITGSTAYHIGVSEQNSGNQCELACIASKITYPIPSGFAILSAA